MSRLLRLTRHTLLTLLVMSPFSAHAADILTTEGLGKVKIGMTPGQAAKALGAKLRPMDSEAESAECWTTRRADGQFAGIWYMIQDGHLTRIDVGLDQDSGQQPDIKTAKGIGLGATEQDVLTAYGPQKVKISPHPYGDPQDHYLLVDTTPGKTGLLFEVEGGKVTTFRAGRHPAIDLSEGCS